MADVFQVDTGSGPVEFAFSAQGNHADLETVDITASFTVDNSDNNSYFRCDGTVVITVPTGLMDTLYFAVKRVGTGEVTIVGASGVKFNGVDTATYRIPVGSDLGNKTILSGYGTTNEYDIDGDSYQSSP